MAYYARSCTDGVAIEDAVLDQYVVSNTIDDSVLLEDVCDGQIQWQGEDAGHYRVEREDAAGYDIYLGINEPPSDFTTPWASFTGIEFETPELEPPEIGTRDYYLVIRRRNRYGLQSLNEYSPDDPFSFKITIAADGSASETPPGAPVNVSISAGPGGTFYINAQYPYKQDASSIAADTFLIYLRSDGTEPDPTIDMPIEVEMVKAGGIARLSPPKGYTTTAFSEGTIGRALVRTRRSGTPDVDSINVYDPGVEATATLLGPVAGGGAGLFFDDQYKQED